MRHRNRRKEKRHVIGDVDGSDMALLHEFSRDVLQRYLRSRRYVVEVGVLQQCVQPVMMHGSIRITEHRFGKAAIVECAKRTVAL